MDFHEFANLIPDMTQEEYTCLVNDIRENGLIEPIAVFEGQILDGRHRYKACNEVGIPPRYTYLNGDTDPLSYVVSKSNRRNLSSGQWATIAVEARGIRERLEREARERQATSTGGANPQLNQNFDEAERGTTLDKMAELFHTNRQYIHTAEKIKEKDPDLFNKVKAGEIPLYQADKQLNGKPHVTNNSGNNEWYTPPEYIAAARAVMGDIDTDPASSDIANQTVGASVYFTEWDDGLNADWLGRVWMNPPYSQPLIGQFCEKFTDELLNENISEGCVLVNNATDTRWYHGLLELSTAVCFVLGRIKFIDQSGKPSGAPLQGQTVLYFGHNVAGFSRSFSPFGKILYGQGKDLQPNTSQSG